MDLDRLLTPYSNANEIVAVREQTTALLLRDRERNSIILNDLVKMKFCSSLIEKVARVDHVTTDSPIFYFRLSAGL